MGSVTGSAGDRAPTSAALRQRRHRARLAAVREIEFIRADWALFLHPDRLPQKAGCPRDRLRAMILKEVVDNALDAGAEAVLDQIDPDTWAVIDDGPGLDREQVVRLFAVNRPMTSTKLVRRPTRGASATACGWSPVASWRAVARSRSRAAVPATLSTSTAAPARRW
jgi:hypothetical protein